MAVPRNRHSTARTRAGKAHHAKSKKHLRTCSKCDSPTLPHRACAACGHYGEGRSYTAREEVSVAEEE